MPTRYIVAVADATELGKVVPIPLPGVASLVFKRDDNTIQVMDPDGVAGTFLSLSTLGIAGVAAGYKLARGVHVQVAQSDTIVTGLATVVAVVISFRDVPTAKQQYVIASIGDQAGTPAAGSVLTKTYKSTLAAADDFTDNLGFNWIAIGT